MNEKKTTNQLLEDDYRIGFIPAVHRIGRLTMLLALILSFLPVVYFVAVKGYSLPLEIYFSGASGVAALGIGMWLSEPETFWPVLGSAGTYIAYLSGNVSGMRFPVATTVQKNMKAEITTPRGQIVTIVGIVASVVANLIILLAIVLAGEWIISVLPGAVVSAFGFCVASLLSTMFVMNLSGRGGVKAIPSVLPYVIVAVAAWFLCTKVFSSLMGWGQAIAVGSAILIGYAKYRNDLEKAEDSGK